MVEQLNKTMKPEKNKIENLYQKLKAAYTIDNLNQISFVLLGFYKNRQFGTLRKVAEIVSDCVKIEITDDGKGFSAFMMLYHPDRLAFHINEINKFATEKNYEGLLNYSHILLLERIEEIATSLESYEDIDYSPVYEWDINIQGFSIFYDTDSKKKTKTSTKSTGCSFYDALKTRFFEDITYEYPTWYLEDMEEFELSSADINDLDGIQFCVHAKNIDLSDNNIIDLSLLAGLREIEELNLSYNKIGIIDELSNLTNLKNLYLADNPIDDISPLFVLEKLEYIDLSDNKIDPDQIKTLVEMGIEVTS
ncbi:MAG: leucine-rich repeat domain-containing protein [Mariniphaga sp.]|jgi:hypothetical protein|nr:leucine-rich repeat domain-containing protein [Mariniphaga sp.]